MTSCPRWSSSWAVQLVSRQPPSPASPRTGRADHKAFGERDLAGSDYVYVRADGIHLRTTNPIESTFATVRLRTKVTRGAGSAAAALAMVFNLVESAQARRRAVNAPHLVTLVRAGAGFDHGMLIERSETIAA